jgi:hypothetical protein
MKGMTEFIKALEKKRGKASFDEDFGKKKTREA